ncbi:hypothetical protein [Gelidibacter sp.]|uniref:hypothetical protein n=1 Tax=Gelidibacter sp. TaxID=2018083 RepID=UPI002B820180|nr:hypothetical protein [Gelidibacter sp.]HUH27681.1 hypothetical protein [Gelidibacter sp.]
MTPDKYAQSKFEDNVAAIRHFVGGKNVMFLALFGSIVDCHISMHESTDDSEKLAFFYQAKCHLVQQLEIYCLANKDLLINANQKPHSNV